MKRLILSAAALICALAAMSALLGKNESAREKSVAVLSPATVTAVTAAEPQGMFLVKSEDGFVVVAEKSSGRILRKTETQTALLPPDDRERLERGIEVKSESELRSLLEDICS